jgi:hypothetical protein
VYPSGAAGPGAVLHHDLLAELIAERLLQDARGGVGAAAGLEAHHDGDWLGWKSTLRGRRAAREQCRDETDHPSHCYSSSVVAGPSCP